MCIFMENLFRFCLVIGKARRKVKENVEKKLFSYVWIVGKGKGKHIKKKRKDVRRISISFLSH